MNVPTDSNELSLTIPPTTRSAIQYHYLPASTSLKRNTQSVLSWSAWIKQKFVRKMPDRVVNAVYGPQNEYQKALREQSWGEMVRGESREVDLEMGEYNTATERRNRLETIKQNEIKEDLKNSGVFFIDKELNYPLSKENFDEAKRRRQAYKELMALVGKLERQGDQQRQTLLTEIRHYLTEDELTSSKLNSSTDDRSISECVKRLKEIAEKRLESDTRYFTENCLAIDYDAAQRTTFYNDFLYPFSNFTPSIPGLIPGLLALPLTEFMKANPTLFYSLAFVGQILSVELQSRWAASNILQYSPWVTLGHHGGLSLTDDSSFFRKNVPFSDELIEILTEQTKDFADAIKRVNGENPGGPDLTADEANAKLIETRDALAKTLENVDKRERYQKLGFDWTYVQNFIRMGRNIGLFGVSYAVAFLAGSPYLAYGLTAGITLIQLPLSGTGAMFDHLRAYESALKSSYLYAPLDEPEACRTAWTNYTQLRLKQYMGHLDDRIDDCNRSIADLYGIPYEQYKKVEKYKISLTDRAMNEHPMAMPSINEHIADEDIVEYRNMAHQEPPMTQQQWQRRIALERKARIPLDAAELQRYEKLKKKHGNSQRMMPHMRTRLSELENQTNFDPSEQSESENLRYLAERSPTRGESLELRVLEMRREFNLKSEASNIKNGLGILADFTPEKLSDHCKLINKQWWADQYLENWAGYASRLTSKLSSTEQSQLLTALGIPDFDTLTAGDLAHLHAEEIEAMTTRYRDQLEDPEKKRLSERAFLTDKDVLHLLKLIEKHNATNQQPSWIEKRMLEVYRQRITTHLTPEEQQAYFALPASKTPAPAILSSEERLIRKAGLTVDEAVEMVRLVKEHEAWALNKEDAGELSAFNRRIAESLDMDQQNQYYDAVLKDDYGLDQAEFKCLFSSMAKIAAKKTSSGNPTAFEQNCERLSNQKDNLLYNKIMLDLVDWESMGQRQREEWSKFLHGTRWTERQLSALTHKSSAKKESAYQSQLMLRRTQFLNCVVAGSAFVYIWDAAKRLIQVNQKMPLALKVPLDATFLTVSFWTAYQYGELNIRKDALRDQIKAMEKVGEVMSWDKKLAVQMKFLFVAVTAKMELSKVNRLRRDAQNLLDEHDVVQDTNANDKALVLPPVLKKDQQWNALEFDGNVYPSESGSVKNSGADNGHRDNDGIKEETTFAIRNVNDFLLYAKRIGIDDEESQKELRDFFAEQDKTLSFPELVSKLIDELGKSASMTVKQSISKVRIDIEEVETPLHSVTPPKAKAELLPPPKKGKLKESTRRSVSKNFEARGVFSRETFVGKVMNIDDTSGIVHIEQIAADDLSPLKSKNGIVRIMHLNDFENPNLLRNDIGNNTFTITIPDFGPPAPQPAWFKAAVGTEGESQQFLDNLCPMDKERFQKKLEERFKGQSEVIGQDVSFQRGSKMMNQQERQEIFFIDSEKTAYFLAKSSSRRTLTFIALPDALRQGERMLEGAAYSIKYGQRQVQGQSI